MIPHRKKFGNMYYYLDSTHDRLQEANHFARKYRQHGEYARVVKLENKYVIYSRRK